MACDVEITVGGTSRPDLADASRIEVDERAGQTTTYGLTYSVDLVDGELPKLVDSGLAPGTMLTISVIIDGRLQCLVHGPVHGQSIHLLHGGDGSTVEVRGSDSSVAMDRETKSTAFADVTDSDAVTTIVGSYGYVADVKGTTAGHMEKNHILMQRRTDLGFVRRLAERNGCLFWVTSDPHGNETAHFKRPPLSGMPAAVLTINQDNRNLDEVQIEWDIERPNAVETMQLDLNTKGELDGGVTGSPLELLGKDGLASIAGDTRSIHLAAPADDAGDLTSRAEGALIEAGWFVKAACETSRHELGNVVRAHTVVELRGAGERHSGKYFVSAVRHVIEPASHRMHIEMVRNAWG